MEEITDQYFEINELFYDEGLKMELKCVELADNCEGCAYLIGEGECNRNNVPKCESDGRPDDTEVMFIEN
jgi:hypothetical protein